MLDIKIKTIPDKEQRYNTTGDYYIDEKIDEKLVRIKYGKRPVKLG